MPLTRITGDQATPEHRIQGEKANPHLVKQAEGINDGSLSIVARAEPGDRRDFVVRTPLTIAPGTLCGPGYCAGRTAIAGKKTGKTDTSGLTNQSATTCRNKITRHSASTTDLCWLIAILFSHFVSAIPLFFQLLVREIGVMAISRRSALHTGIHTCFSGRCVSYVM